MYSRITYHIKVLWDFLLRRYSVKCKRIITPNSEEKTSERNIYISLCLLSTVLPFVIRKNHRNETKGDVDVSYPFLITKGRTQNWTCSLGPGHISTITRLSLILGKKYNA